MGGIWCLKALSGHLVVMDHVFISGNNSREPVEASSLTLTLCYTCEQVDLLTINKSQTKFALKIFALVYLGDKPYSCVIIYFPNIIMLYTCKEFRNLNSKNSLRMKGLTYNIQLSAI